MLFVILFFNPPEILDALLGTNQCLIFKHPSLPTEVSLRESQSWFRLGTSPGCLRLFKGGREAGAEAMDEGCILPKQSAGVLQPVSPMTPHTELSGKGTLKRPR